MHHPPFTQVTLNWMVAAHKLRIYNYIILSLDEEIHGALTRVQAPSFLPPDPLWAQSQDPLYRWKLVAEALHRGISVLYTEPSAVLIRSPFAIIAGARSHIIAGDARPPDHRQSALAPKVAAGKLALTGDVVDEGQVDPSFVWLRASNHMLSLMLKIVAGISAKARDSPGRAFNHVLNGGPGGFVTWSAAPMRDPHLHSEQRVVDGTTASGLRVSLWQDGTIRKFGCGNKNPLAGVTVLNCVFSSFSFGQALEGANQAQTTELGLKAVGAWVLSPTWARVKPQGTLPLWLGLVSASETQVKQGLACRAGQGGQC